MAGFIHSLCVCVLFVWLSILNFSEAQSVYTEIGNISINLPGFSNVYEHEGWTDPTERYSLLLSTFSAIPFTRDSSFFFLYVGKFLNDLSSFVPNLLYDDFSWPREITQTPFNVFNYDSVTQPDGFLPPGKDNGSIFVLDVSDINNPLTYDIVRDPVNPDPLIWFYHQVTWKDMDLDGDLDALTCRVRSFGVPAQEETQMLWLEHNSADPFSAPWELHLIHENICGTFQVGTTLDVSGVPTYALFTCGYFTNLFAVHWSTNPTGSWENPADIQTRIIDTGHQFFNMELADLNQDGRLDILVTWNAEVNGSLVAYEIPDDFRSGEYNLHILAEGFVARSGLQGGGTPGAAHSYYPDTDETGKPWILLSGDDDGRTYYMTAQSPDPLDWNYDLIAIRDEGERNIMGQPSAMDADGDGKKEIYIPVYYGEAVHVYEYTP